MPVLPSQARDLYDQCDAYSLLHIGQSRLTCEAAARYLVPVMLRQWRLSPAPLALLKPPV